MVAPVLIRLPDVSALDGYTQFETIPIVLLCKERARETHGLHNESRRG